MNVRFNESVLRVDDTDHVLDFPIIDAATDGDRVYVVFDYTAFPKNKPAGNLSAYDKDGHRLWTVSGNPIDHPTAAYTNIIDLKPLTVGNFAGFVCQINETTGELIQSDFTK
ncbi:MAG: hypothetical protein AAGG02_19050 [Cyanobacteria bacterium P01_H01_bin.15]